MSWNDYTDDLHPSDTELITMSVQDVEKLFYKATAVCDINEYADAFWTHYSSILNSQASLQGIVNTLEQLKRRLGRKYDINKNDFILRRYLACKYNCVEAQIQYICSTFNVKRKSKAYYLGL